MTKNEREKLEKIKNEPLKLMRWRIANFPPIDLNENYMHVVELTYEIIKLRKELKEKNELR